MCTEYILLSNIVQIHCVVSVLCIIYNVLCPCIMRTLYLIYDVLLSCFIQFVLVLGIVEYFNIDNWLLNIDQ